MINYRKFPGVAALALATLALSPQLVRSQQLSGKLLQRAIPSTGEMIPAIGLAFSNHPSCADQTALKEVMKTFADNGGRYIDATLGNAANQKFHMNAASELGIASKTFWSTTAYLPGPNSGPAGVKTQIDSALARSGAAKIDVGWVTAAGPPEILAALKEEKKAGRVKYIGALTIVVKSQAAQLEALMRNEPLDFIGVEYDIGNRFVEETILPLAREKKIGVVAFFPFSNNAGTSCTAMSRNLFSRVGTKPLPEWAAEFDAKSWAQFFLKYVLSHPAVTVARVGTTKATHMLDNMGGGVGKLPNEATRKRMAALVDSLPPLPPMPVPPSQVPGIAVPAAVLERYVGTYKSPAGTMFVFRREGDRLFVKPGANPEAPLNARTETRFQDPRGPFFDFQLDAQGKVTGAILEQQGPQGPQKSTLERQP
jgi:aryl-alcohol dehydrogenase-like predicted oxidoreductase